jgi:Protein of unknown function (DUF1592)/Protein of unknown function (DUF1588)/Protein of unknown function (DUF1587)/Protein of unknown function (DUF1585)/Protein of unknown function (DUF1595)/Cytochrome C oxidase, cbb3-type, subunit III
MRACVALSACLSSWLVLAVPVRAQTAGPLLPDASASQAVVSRYCVSCHNGRLKTAGLELDRFDLSHVADHPDIWEKVVRKLRADAMPPAGAPRPDAATSDRLRAWLEERLDAAAALTPNPGRPLLHRLNRAEYANAIRDLLALDVDAAALLPPDDSSYGFDNVADVLGVSPVLLERYLTAANRVSALAVGETGLVPASETYRARQDLSQDQHIEGLPLGTIGGMQARHTFPLDAEYGLQIKLFRTNLNAIRGTEFPHQLEVTVDGARVFFDTVGGERDATAVFNNPTNASDAIDARLKARVRVTAGPHVIGVAFLRDISEGSRRLQPFVRSSADTYDITGRPHVSSITIAGPYNATGPGDTPSRRRIFVCTCPTQIVSTLARRAFRRPVAAKDLEPLMRFYEAGRKEAGFERGIQFALERILASPEFVFRAEPDPPSVAPGSVYRLGDLALASRLSFFLWSSIPDDELLTAASRRTLTRGAVFEQQVRRMLSDPRAGALVSNFAGQWLQLRNLNSAQPISTEFPDFDDNLRQGFRRETELLFETVMREDRSVLELLTADFTYVNERLARHYGMPNVYGSRMRRVPVADPARRGILGHGSILTVTSHADRTSPVVRGKWILENLLGVPPPPPLPGVSLEDEGDEAAPRTMRERMERHRANPQCASCHRLMDPLGFALENFDAVGAWRTTDAGKPIDTAGQLINGARVDGVVALREALLKRPEVFVSTMTEKLLVYALGRGLDATDMPAVRTIVRNASAGGYRFSSLVLGIASSVPFRSRTARSDMGRPF